MSTPYVGEIRMFGGNFAPVGWATCDGQLLDIATNDTLFALIGTTYGGDGLTTFALPNMSGRLPVHQGPGYVIGQLAGVEFVGLSVAQIPAHTHELVAATGGTKTASPAGAYLASGGPNMYASKRVTPTSAALQSGLSSAGSTQPHDNMMPYLCVTFIISLFGIFPPQA